MTDPFGNIRGAGGGGPPVRAHDGQVRGRQWFTAEQVAPEVADVGRPVGGDHHVVRLTGGNL